MQRRSVRGEKEQELNRRILDLFKRIDTEHEFTEKGTLVQYFQDFEEIYKIEYEQTHPGNKDAKKRNQINLLDKIYAFLFPFIKNGKKIAESQPGTKVALF